MSGQKWFQGQLNLITQETYQITNQ